MAGLLGDVLPYVYSRGNALRRQLDWFFTDPGGTASQSIGLLADKSRENQNLLAQAFQDQQRPFHVTDSNALGQAGMNMLNGLLGFAPAGMTASALRQITPDEARMLVAGKTEKPGGTDPHMLIGVSEGNGKRMSYGRVPLSAVRANEEGALYDGTVNAARAVEYAQRPPDNVPPVILTLGRRTSGLFNVIDGGHRVSAARMRGDEDIPAIVMEHGR